MAEIQTSKAHKPKHTSMFLTCFGFSEKRRPTKKSKKNYVWSRFRVRRSKLKTVPVDDCIAPICALKVKSNSSSIVSSPIGLDDEKHQETIKHSFMKNESRQRRLFLRSRQTSPTENPKSIIWSPRPKTNGMSRSNTFHIQRHIEHAIIPIKDKKDCKLAPIVGISIVILVLFAMLLGGRLCAIICTSIWLYFDPRLRNHDVITSPGSVELDLNSERHKKQVVMDGFLERRRN